jgi:hypothetical protein
LLPTDWQHCKTGKKSKQINFSNPVDFSTFKCGMV